MRLPEFVAGVAAGLWFGRRRITFRGEARASTLSGIALLTAPAVMAAPWPSYLEQARHLVLVPVFALLIGALARLLGGRTMVRLGEASYELYRLHLPLYECARIAYDPDATTGHRLVRLATFNGAFWLVAVGLSLAIFRWYEEPARRAIRARFAAPVPAPLIATAA